MSTLRRALTNSHTENRAIASMSLEAFGKYVAAFEDAGTSTESGIRISVEKALKLSTVHGCVTGICDGIGQLPISPFRGTGKETTKLDRKRWMNQPNPENSWTDFTGQWISSALLQGGSMAEITVRNPTSGEIEQIWSIDPRNMNGPSRDNTTNEQYWTTQNGRRIDRYNPITRRGDLIVMKSFSLPGAEWGIPVIEYAREAIALGLVIESFAGSFFGRGTNLSGVIEYPDEWDKDFAEQIAQGFARRHGGWRNAHKPAVLSGGAKWKEMQVTPEAAQFLQSREFQVNEIARWFRYSTDMLAQSDRSSTLATGLEQFGLRYVTYTLMPWLVRSEQTFNTLLPRGEYVRWNLNGLLRADLQTRYESHAIALTNGWANVDEIRELEELPPIEGGSEYYRPLNLSPQGKAKDPAP